MEIILRASNKYQENFQIIIILIIFEFVFFYQFF